jgi:WD40 repeat protein
VPAVRRRPWGCVALLAVVAVALAAAVPTGLVLLRQKGPGEKGPTGSPAPNGPAIPYTGSDQEQVGVHDSTDVNCTGLLFTPDGLIGLSKCAGGHVYLWDLRTPHQQLYRWDVPGGPLGQAPGAFTVSPDGKHVAISAGGTLALVDADSPRRDNNPKPRPQALFNCTLDGRMTWTYAAFSPSASGSSLLAVAEAGGLEHGAVHLVPLAALLTKPAGKPEGASPAPTRLADMPTRTLPPFGAPVVSLAFSADGGSLLGGGGKNVVDLWSLKDAALLRRFRGHTGVVTQVAFSAGPGPARVFTASAFDDSLLARLPGARPQTDGTVRVWDNSEGAGESVEKELLKIEPGKEQTDAEPRKPASPMTCATFWRRRALTGHKDGSVALWDLDTGKLLKWFPHKAIRDAKDTEVAAAAISPDGHHALAAIRDGSVSLYRLPPPPLR